jgi:GTP-binding protein EngB required for normal cell division
MPDLSDLAGLTARTEELLDGLDALTADPPTPDQIGRLRAGLARTEQTVVVVGERNRGKSSLVNAMVGGPLLPVDAIAATAVPIFVRRGSRPAQVTLVTGEGVDFQEIQDLGAWATEARTDAGQVARIDVWSDSPLLVDGIVLVDTPGVGGLDETHRERTMTALRQADAVLLVMDAHQPVSDSEIAFLKEAADLAGAVLFALNKIDDRAEADWTDILADNLRLIERCDPRYAGARIHPVSTRLAQEAASADGDLAAELHEESRIDGLRLAVRDTVLRDGAVLRLASTAGFCAALIERLRAESPPAAGQAGENRLLREVEAAREPGATWRREFRKDRDDLAKDVRRVARKQLEKRVRRVRAAADRRLSAAELADRAAEELEAFVEVLGRRAEDGLRDLRTGVGTALRLEDLADVVADFTTPRVGSVRAAPAGEDVWAMAKLTVSRVELLAALGGVTYREALRSLGMSAARTAGIAAVPGAGAGGAVAAGTAAEGAVVAAPAAGAAEVAAGAGVATAAAVVTVAVVVVVAAAVAYQTHREFVQLQAAAVLDETTKRGDELTRRTVEDLLAVADRLEKLVDTRLRRRAESLAAGEREQQAAEGHRRQLDEWDERCRALRADIAARLAA